MTSSLLRIGNRNLINVTQDKCLNYFIISLLIKINWELQTFSHAHKLKPPYFIIHYFHCKTVKFYILKFLKIFHPARCITRYFPASKSNT